MSGIIGSDLQVESGKFGFPAGHVLQTVSTNFATESATTNSSYEIVHSSFKVEITPTSSSHKILVLLSAPAYSNTANQTMGVTIYRDIAGGTSNTDLGGNVWGFGVVIAPSSATSGCVSCCRLDTPNTMSQITYKVMQKISGGTGYTSINSSRSTLTCMEIEV